MHGTLPPLGDNGKLAAYRHSAFLFCWALLEILQLPSHTDQRASFCGAAGFPHLVRILWSIKRCENSEKNVSKMLLNKMGQHTHHGGKGHGCWLF